MWTGNIPAIAVMGPCDFQTIINSVQGENGKSHTETVDSIQNIISCSAATKDSINLFLNRSMSGFQ